VYKLVHVLTVPTITTYLQRREKLVNNPIKMDKIKQKIALELKEKEDKKSAKKAAKREKKEQKKDAKRRKKEGLRGGTERKWWKQ